MTRITDRPSGEMFPCEKIYVEGEDGCDKVSISQYGKGSVDGDSVESLQEVIVSKFQLERLLKFIGQRLKVVGAA